eukprot:CAMPEP_0114528996 /NCGR_PEP_ID=MMETSP0109-20121206/24565_1 /TAXON_ID=29199 /ORGANISM="Chlorarachnion reptans, Strain CCCM449" /LENGTH=84 /DNA_ID=CAMNT_0001711301 /DNA_START=168 /DNA_END=422 /DNA_ORIENTATION=+
MDMGRYRDPDGFDYDPNEGISSFRISKFGSKAEEKNIDKIAAVPPEKPTIKKVRRRVSSRLAKYGVKMTKTKKNGNNEKSEETK